MATIERPASRSGRAPITFTLDLEDHRPHAQAPLRYPAVARRVLRQLDRHGVTGTFFVVGEIAESEPDLVREIAAHGHEIALHGWTHTPLTSLDRSSFAEQVTRGKAYLEVLADRPVVGFRAPTFSLTRATTWATEVLVDAGFTYSSSVLPNANPLYGFPGAPREPFRWPSGLVELPVPVAGWGRLRVPYLGGTYLRLIPGSLIERAHLQSERRVPWMYVHAYDVDTAERFWVVPDAGWMSPLLWVGRRGLPDKIDALLADGAAGPPLCERLDEADAGGVFDPFGHAVTAGRPGRRTDTSPRPLRLRGPDPTPRGAPMRGEYSQATMVHRLPRAPLVDRIDYLTTLARGRRVIHVGFVDTGCRSMQDRSDTWLHGHLDETATSLVGIDVDEAGVKRADAAGFEAYCADCRDPEAIDALGIAPAQLVIAGEVIEHVDDPGDFLAALHRLVVPGGQLVITTPNAYGLFNVLASLARREINHPDHVVMFTWQTLTNLAGRHGWEPIDTRVYVPSVKQVSGPGRAGRALAVAGRLAVGMERTLARVGRSYAADGMIVVFRAR
jgi:polysaccharide deacetylase family protein (PEP-CTERM system associated)